MALIEFKNVAHSYMRSPARIEDYALRPMNLAWRHGGAYALLGPSGSGKTTLLNIISGLLRPSAGRVLFDGRDVTDSSPVQRNIAQVFQFPVIYDTMTVAENLAFPLRNRGVERRRIAERVKQVASMLDLSSDLHRMASGLTADMKQKISLGRGLVREDVRAILFDEPLTVIDPHLKWQLRGALKRVHRHSRTTMVYVTHDQTEALTFADRVVVMLEGEVVQIGTPQELFEQPAHTFVGYFIGSPGMNVLPAVVDGDTARIGDSTITLSSSYPTFASGQKVEVGIRPEFLRIARGGQGLKVKVLRVEDAGSRRIVRAELGGVPIAAIAGEDEAVPTGCLSLEPDPGHVHVYVDSKLVRSDRRG
jgi:glycerol transport system ATP-binding protein